MLIAEQPTRGVDIGATEFIHGQLVAERDKGRAVLLVSAELSEILALSDRILVMYEGRILADVPRSEANEETLGPADGRARAGAAMSDSPSRRRSCAAAAAARRDSRFCSPRSIGGVLVFASGANPLDAYAQIVAGSLVLGQSAQHAELGDAAGRHDAGRGDSAARRHDQSRRRRADGHRRASSARSCRSICPVPARWPRRSRSIAAALAAGLYAALAAWGEMRLAIPMLISSLLLSYPAVGIASYLARFPLARHHDRLAADRACSRWPRGCLTLERAAQRRPASSSRRSPALVAFRRPPHGRRLRTAHARRSTRALPAMAACGSTRRRCA